MNLLDPVTFLESFTADVHGDPTVWDDWQCEYLRDESMFLVAVKSRQTGFSYAGAAKGLYKALTIPSYSKYFVSTSLNESKSKIEYAKNLYDSLPNRYKLPIETNAKTEIAFKDNKGIVSRIKALTSKEPRGPHGDLDLDEAAFLRNAQKIYEAGIAFTARGGQLALYSSPAGQSGLLYDVFTNAQNRYPSFTRLRVPWWWSSGLCIDPRTAVKAAPNLSVDQRVEAFGTDRLKAIYQSISRDAFAQEFECAFVDEASAFLPYSLITQCSEDSWGDSLDESDIDPDGSESVRMQCRVYEGKSGSEPTDDFWQWLRKACKGLVEIGFDVGRQHDVSAIVVTDEVDDKKDVRAIITLDRMEFASQLQIAENVLLYSKASVLRIDNTGMGMPLAEQLETKYKSRIEKVNFSNSSKATMATNVKARMEQGKLRLPTWDVIREHFHSIRKSVTASNLIAYDADSAQHHGDIFWAVALTDYRGERQIISAAPRFGRSKREFSPEAKKYKAPF